MSEQMHNSLKITIQKIISGLLSFILIFGIIPFSPAGTLSADAASPVRSVVLNVSKITPPTGGWSSEFTSSGSFAFAKDVDVYSTSSIHTIGYTSYQNKPEKWKAAIYNTSALIRPSLSGDTSINAGSTYTFNSSFATSLDYDQMSGIIYNAANEVLAYGRIGSVISGEHSFKMPSELGKGSYTLWVFLEKFNTNNADRIYSIGRISFSIKDSTSSEQKGVTIDFSSPIIKESGDTVQPNAGNGMIPVVVTLKDTVNYYFPEDYMADKSPKYGITIEYQAPARVVIYGVPERRSTYINLDPPAKRTVAPAPATTEETTTNEPSHAATGETTPNDPSPNSPANDNEASSNIDKNSESNNSNGSTDNSSDTDNSSSDMFNSSDNSNPGSSITDSSDNSHNDNPDSNITNNSDNNFDRNTDDNSDSGTDSSPDNSESNSPNNSNAESINEKQEESEINQPIPPSYIVTVIVPADSGITIGTSNSSQKYITNSGTSIINTVYHANSGYYFPTDYYVTPVNGINVTRNSSSQITISGTPTNNTIITLKPATAITDKSSYVTTPIVDKPSYIATPIVDKPSYVAIPISASEETANVSPKSTTSQTVVSVSDIAHNNDLLNISAKVVWNKKKKAWKLTWNTIDDAHSYKIYAGEGKKTANLKQYSSISSKKKKITVYIKKINGKKINQSKLYQFQIRAYGKTDNNTYIGTSRTLYIAGSKNKSHTNIKKIKPAKKKISLNKNSSIKLTTMIRKERPSKSLITGQYGRKLYYISSDKNVADVDIYGNVKGIHSGTCQIHIITQNGENTTVSVRIR